MACIVRRRDRWVIDFYDNQGRRRWKTLPKGSTKEKAKDVIREIEDRLAKGVYLPEKKIPIFQNMAKQWLEYKKPNIRQSTWEMYRSHLKYRFEY